MCNKNQIFQYYNFGKGLQFIGEQPMIENFFREKLKLQEDKGESGFLTIRFVVNCEGKTGWFRVKGIDNDYKEKIFKADLVNQFLTLAKQLDGWIGGVYKDRKFDYYQYLTFKITEEKLIEITP